MPICFAIMVIFQKNFIFLKMAIIWLQLTEISLKFESSSQNLFDFNRLNIPRVYFRCFGKYRDYHISEMIKVINMSMKYYYALE